MKTVCVVNPASANGSTGRRWPEVSARLTALGVEHTSMLTAKPGDATGLTADALAAGADTVVAVGGDGTLNEVANGFFRDGPPPSRAALGLLPFGTGGDFRRTVGIPLEFEAAAAVIKARHTRPLDVGRIDMAGLDGIPVTRYFINIADAGIGGVVVERVNNTSKLFGGKASFMFGTIMTLLSYRPQKVEVMSADGSFEGPAQNVVVANGQYFGGSMRVAPDADPSDGQLDVVVFGDIARFEAIRSIGDLYKSAHLKNPKVKHWRTSELHVISPERVLIDVDGEMSGTLPATFKVLPGALTLVVPG